jgi:hypothetical protein
MAAVGAPSSAHDGKKLTAAHRMRPGLPFIGGSASLDIFERDAELHPHTTIGRRIMMLFFRKLSLAVLATLAVCSVVFAPVSASAHHHHHHHHHH